MLSNKFILPVPELTRDLADQIADAAKKQLETSINYKAPFLARVKENEDLYFGVVEKQLKNPFNESFPFMSGAVDSFLARVDDAPRVTFGARRQAAWKSARKVQAAWDQFIQSSAPDSKVKYKDRVGKKLGIIGGRSIHKFFSEAPQGNFRAAFSTVDYKLFHTQPDGGGASEDHLYMGEEGIFLTKEQLVRGAQLGYYDDTNVAELATKTGETAYKQTTEEQNELYSRHAALGLDPKTHTYVGQEVFHCVEWYLTFQGVRWYVLFEKQTGKWIRVKPLRELFSIPKGYADALFPYATWATFEEFGLFWSKANADDWRPVAKYMNRALNQELYNREKINKGQRLYDPDMVPDVGMLADWRPDGLTPVDTKGGKRKPGDAVYNLTVNGLNGTLDLVSYLDSFVGKNTGSTPGSKGAAEKDKKVGIFFGELQQVDEFIGTRNKSYVECWEEIALRFLMGLKDNLSDEGIEIELVGEAGFIAETLTKKDMEYLDHLSISVVGGTEMEEKDIVEKRERREILTGLSSVNPRWKDEQLLRTGPFKDDEIAEAFNFMPVASKALLSEAAQSIEEIKEGRKPKLNAGANTAFMAYIVRAAQTNEELDDKTREKMIDYATEHAEIAAGNEAREALLIRSQQQRLDAALGGGKEKPAEEEVPATVPSPLDQLAGSMKGGVK